jgi:hypothetical protein
LIVAMLRVVFPDSCERNNGQDKSTNASTRVEILSKLIRRFHDHFSRKSKNTGNRNAILFMTKRVLTKYRTT